MNTDIKAEDDLRVTRFEVRIPYDPDMPPAIISGTLPMRPGKFPSGPFAHATASEQSALANAAYVCVVQMLRKRPLEMTFSRAPAPPLPPTVAAAAAAAAAEEDVFVYAYDHSGEFERTKARRTERRLARMTPEERERERARAQAVVAKRQANAEMRQERIVVRRRRRIQRRQALQARVLEGTED